MNSPIEQFLEQYYFRHPVNATFTGMRLHDHEYPDWTREARDDEQDEFEALTVALDDAYPPSEDWAELARNAPALDAELCRASLDVRQLEFESRYFHDKNPALWTGEALFGVIGLMLRPPMPVEEAFASIAMRLHDMPRFLGDMRETITEAMPPQWVERAARESRVGADLLRTRLSMWLDAHGADEASRAGVLEAGEVAAASLSDTAIWLEALPRDEQASMAIGAEAYGILLKRGHCCDTDADTMLQRVQDAMPAAQERFEALAIEVAGSPEGLSEALADDAPSANDFLAAFSDKWEACREFAADHDLVEWGDWPLRYA
ncbi:MAG: DUF885 family protein, partial [Gemmatimonas sp.]